MDQVNYKINYDSLIGSGCNGKVHNCKRELNGQQDEICVKIIQNQYCNEKKIQTYFQIINQLNSIKNPNLIKIYDIQYNAYDLNIFMEKCAKGENLNQIFKKKRQSKTWFIFQETISIIRQFILGYKDLLYYNWIHREIKPSNILIDDNGTPKITDFLMARILDDMPKKRQESLNIWNAPEIFFYEFNYSSKSDIYSLGLIFYEMLYNALPFKDLQNKKQQDQFLLSTEINPIKCPNSQNIPVEVSQLVERMLRFKEEDRIDWNQLINHQIFMFFGYDRSRFLNLNTQTFDCLICLMVARDPKYCNKCDSVFCKVCVDDWFRKQNGQCPMQCDIKQSIIAPIQSVAKKLYSELKIKCEKCAMSMLIGELQKHEIYCSKQNSVQKTNSIEKQDQLQAQIQFQNQEESKYQPAINNSVNEQQQIPSIKKQRRIIQLSQNPQIQSDPSNQNFVQNQNDQQSNQAIKDNYYPNQANMNNHQHNQTIKNIMLIIQNNIRAVYINQNDAVNFLNPRAQRIKKLIEVILTKGDIALDLLNQLQMFIDMYPDIGISQFDLTLLASCLIGYKQTTVQTALGMIQQNIDHIDRNLKSALLKFNQNKNEEFEQLRNEISRQSYLMNEWFTFTYNQLIRYFMQGIPQKLDKYFKLLNLQSSVEFSLYFKWFLYFYEQLLKNKLQFSLEYRYPTDYLRLLYLCEQFINLENDFPIQGYQGYKTSNIKLHENINDEELIKYIRLKRKI